MKATEELSQFEKRNIAYDFLNEVKKIYPLRFLTEELEEFIGDIRIDLSKLSLPEILTLAAVVHTERSKGKETINNLDSGKVRQKWQAVLAVLGIESDWNW